MKAAQLRGLVYAAHADGHTYNRIAAALGISGREARQIDADTRRLIAREADRWFSRPPLLEEGDDDDGGR